MKEDRVKRVGLVERESRGGVSVPVSCSAACWVTLGLWRCAAVVLTMVPGCGGVAGAHSLTKPSTQPVRTPPGKTARAVRAPLWALVMRWTWTSSGCDRS